jgi:hypothetical protein
MEKLIEDLIHRLQSSKKEVLLKLEKDACSKDDKLTLILTGKLFAYEQCIHELQRVIHYYQGCPVKD